MDCAFVVWAPYELSIFTATVCAILCVASVMGNSLIICAVVQNPLKKLRSPFTYFLLNLAASDLVGGALMLPIGVYIHTDEALGHVSMFQVKLMHMSYFVSATSSVFSLMALSLDRYLAITFAIEYRQHLRWSRCIMISAGIWLLSLTLPFMYLKLGYFHYLLFYCHSAILIALIVLVVTYVKIYSFLRLQTQQMATMQRTTSAAAEEFRLLRMRQEKKVTRTFLWILILFISTYVPALAIIYILQFCYTCDCITIHVLRDLQFLLISSNSCMNPFICTVRLKHFRMSISALIKSTVCCHLCASVQHEDFDGIPDGSSADSAAATIPENILEGNKGKSLRSSSALAIKNDHTLMKGSKQV